MRLWAAPQSLDPADRLTFERLLQYLRLTFLASPFLVLVSVGPAALGVATLIGAVTLLSYCWIWLLLRRAPQTLLRWQLLLRVVDCGLVYVVLTPYHAILHHAFYDSVYILFIVAAAATHGRRGGLLLAAVADLTMVASRYQLVLFGAIPPETRHAADAIYYLGFFAGIGVAVAFLMEHSASVVERRERQWREALAERNRELERAAVRLTAANKELEAFAYSVSHDLRAPLRAIDGFSRVVMDTAGETLAPQHRDYLGRVRAASQRMAQLIDDLLRLSRVTRTDVRRERVDLSALAADVVRGLRDAHPERVVAVEIEPGLVAEGDARLLRVVMENLIGNAWKFTSKRNGAAIRFGATRVDGPDGASETAYYVRDNGAGFDMAYADKLFGAFQRLHGPEEFEGTGIGLATVQRIVHRHGGRIWADAAPEQGARFSFTL